MTTDISTTNAHNIAQAIDQSIRAQDTADAAFVGAAVITAELLPQTSLRKVGAAMRELGHAASTGTVQTLASVGMVLALDFDPDHDAVDFDCEDDVQVAVETRRLVNAAVNNGVGRKDVKGAITGAADRGEAIAALSKLRPAKDTRPVFGPPEPTVEVPEEVVTDDAPKTDADRFRAIANILSGMTNDGSVAEAVLNELNAVVSVGLIMAPAA
jgi:hypothetical protein